MSGQDTEPSRLASLQRKPCEAALEPMQHALVALVHWLHLHDTRVPPAIDLRPLPGEPLQNRYGVLTPLAPLEA